MRFVAALLCCAAAVLPADRGEIIFQGQCAICHGAGGEGGTGPSLSRAKLRRAPDDEALKRIVRHGIAGTSMPATWLNDAEQTEVAAFVRRLGRRVQPSAAAISGDRQRGATLFASAKAACANCHMIRGEGGAFGPDLTEVGARRSPAHLRQSIVDPGAAVERDFAMIQAGNVRGVRVNEDTFSVQVRDASGKVHSFWKSGLASYRKELGKTAMPRYAAFTPGELDDLVAYLASLTGDPQ